MPPAWVTNSLDWISAHPLLTLALLSLSVAVEGLLIIGLFIPGSVLMFAAGAVVAFGALPLIPTLTAAVMGAWVGDVLSFMIGRHFQHDLAVLCHRWRVPGVLQRSERFFKRWGPMSVVLGRFIGPLRPLVPAVAGAAQMRPAGFVLVNLIAACLWAPAYALPGLVIGATINVAAEVTTRLGLAIALLVASIWFCWWLVRISVWLLQSKAEVLIARMMDWTHRHRRLGRLGPALADPDQPETPVLALCMLALMLIGYLVGLLIWGFAPERPPRLDELAFDWLAGVSFPGSQLLAAALSSLASRDSGLALMLTGLGLFGLARMGRAAGHWLAAGLAAALIGLILPGRDQMLAPEVLASDGPAILMFIILSSSLAGMLATRHAPAARTALYSVTGTAIALVGLAKLTLGSLTLTQFALASALGLSWSSLLLLGYRRHLRGTQGAPLTISVVAASLALVIPAMTQWQQRTPEIGPSSAVTQISAMNWRSHAAAKPPARINLLWVGDLSVIESNLRDGHWRNPPRHDLPGILSWFRGDAELAETPPLPRALAGRMPRLELVYEHPTELMLIRLWPSGQAVQGRGELWHGSVSALRFRSWLGVFRIPVASESTTAARTLQAQLSGQWRLDLPSSPPDWLIIEP